MKTPRPPGHQSPTRSQNLQPLQAELVNVGLWRVGESRAPSSNEEPPSLKRSPKVLLVANAYPSPHALYKNGFLHRRVLAYMREGVRVSVFYVHPPVKTAYEYWFEGVHVTVGNEAAYREHLGLNRFDSVLIHFVSPAMWQPLLEPRWWDVPVVVWVHGFESEAWFRRWFTFLGGSRATTRALEQNVAHHQPQLALLRRIFEGERPNVTVVNISHWFLENVVVPDVGAAPTRGVVIPNYVDGDLFTASPPQADFRKKILSIRPFASTKYANDLTVEAILELSRRPYFGELSFTIVGEGALFDEVTAPLKQFPNVDLVNRFLTQEEVARAHKQHGVFLCPTRFDSQGVSMCEAMASGLVPVSTDVAAIPEFVHDGHTGLLSPGEDPLGLAESIERLFFNPELFERLSANAARGIRSQCGFDATIGKELEVIAGAGVATTEIPAAETVAAETVAAESAPPAPAATGCDFWEPRYRTLEETIGQMILFSAAQSEKDSAPRVYPPTTRTAGRTVIVEFPVRSDQARFAFWVYEDGRRSRRLPYSFSSVLHIEPRAGVRYSVRAFGAERDESDWCFSETFDLGVLVEGSAGSEHVGRAERAESGVSK